MELSRFLQLVLKFKRNIIWFALAISVIVFLVGYMFLKYEVETKVLIKPIGFQAQENVSKSFTGLVSSPKLNIMVEHGNSYVQILTSRKLIREAVTRLELDKGYFDNQTLFTRLIDNLKQPLRFIKYGRLPATPKNSLEMAIGQVMKNINASLHIKSSIIRLTVKDKDAYRAAAIANTLVDSFLGYTRANNTRAAKATINFIEQHLVETRSELDSNKNKLKKLKSDHGIFAFSSFSNERGKIYKKLEDMEQQYEGNNYRLEIAKATLAQIKKEMSKYSEYKKALYSLNSNPTLRELKGNLLSLKMDLQQLLIDHSPQDIQVKAIKDRIAMTEKAISIEVERLLTKEEYTINPIRKGLLDQLESNKNKLNKLKAEHGIFAFSSFSNEKGKIYKKLEDMEQQYEGNNYRLEIAKATLAQIKKEMSKYSEYKKALYTLNSNPTLRELKGNLLSLKMDLQQMLIDYSPQNIQVKAIKDRIAMTEKAISIEVERFLTREEYQINPIYRKLLDQQFSLDIELKTLPFLNKLILERTKKYRDRLTEFEAVSTKVSDFNNTIQYLRSLETSLLENLIDQQFSLDIELKTLPFLNKLILERIKKYRNILTQFEAISTKVSGVNNNISNLKALEDSLLRDLYTAKALEARGLEEVQILDRALAPRYPNMRGLPLFLFVIISFTSGLIFSSFFIILKTQLKGTIIDETDVINEGVCPSAKTISISLANKRQRQRYNMQKLTKGDPLYLYEFIQSSKMEDEFRYLVGRFCCGGFMDSSDPKCYCVTSSKSKEGTTTIAANLAVALAANSRKVVIVDCQKVSPKINELFRLGKKKGIVEYMENPSQTMVDRIIVTSASKGLSVVTYGNGINERANRFYSREFNFLLKELKSRFDNVIIDCPPVIESTESLSVAINSEVDGALLVVQANRARKADLVKACSYIESVNTKLLAVICNKI